MRNRPLFHSIAVNSVLQAPLLTSIAPSLFRARRYNLYHRAHHGLTKCFIQKLNRQNKFIILYLQVKVNPITTKSLNYA